MITCLALNILSEGITDAMAAAPSAALDPTDSSKRREADLLVSDPVRAYKEQAQSLSARLGALRDVELKRDDRHVPDESVEPILSVRDFCIQFEHHGDINVVDHVNFDVRPGQTMGLVGESGCGKSITTLAIMGLTDDDEHLSGEVLWEGRDLLKMSKKEWFGLRGTDIAMVYQDALSSLNPSMLISAQMKQLTKRGGTRSAEELLELVGLDPKRTLESYPHELSGGQRQRVLIAMALTRDPKLVICDEPTTALDVTVQKQVIKLLNDLQAKLGFAMIFVSHDLALVAEVAHNITVMYAGQVIEQAPTKELLTNPIHEYTRGLLGSVLSIESGSGRLHQVPGAVPSPRDFPKGDRFAPRSSHPRSGLYTRPVFKRVPGTEHFYSELPDEVELCDISLQSDIIVLRALNEEAKKQGKVHEVILMMDLGDLREGFWHEEDALDAALEIEHELKNLRLAGVGVNLSCYGSVLPTKRNMQGLVSLASDIEREIGRKLDYISGGASTSAYMAMNGTMPYRINLLRLGDIGLRGETDNFAPDFLETGVMTIKAEVIECRDKPSFPVGELGVNAFGEVGHYEDRGIRRRALVARGRVDYGNCFDLIPRMEGIEVIGASSDHTILDVEAVKDKVHVGDVLEFGIKAYGPMAYLTSSDGVHMVFKGGKQNA